MIANLFQAPARFWSLGASTAQTILDGGLRRSTLRQYTAQFNADVAAYKQAVLTAFQQVEDSIATLRILSQQIQRQQAAVDAAQKWLDIATTRYQTGIDPYLNVITAETTRLSDQQMLVTLRVQEMVAAVQLVQALGGGWDVTHLASAGEVRHGEGGRRTDPAIRVVSTAARKAGVMARSRVGSTQAAMRCS